MLNNVGELMKKALLTIYSPVGNCAEANLVSKIPAPSIKASRIPPIAAEPTMATGPSVDTRNSFNTRNL